MKQGFIINLTKHTIVDKIEIELENCGVKTVEGIDSGDIVKFGKSTFLKVGKINSIKINDTTLTNFDSVAKINDSLYLTFVQGKHVDQTLVDLGVIGMVFTSPKGYVGSQKLLCINTSKWILPVYGYVRSTKKEEKLIAFPFPNDITTHEIDNPESVESLKIIDIGYIFCNKPLLKQKRPEPGGPNAVIGVEIGDPLTAFLFKVIYWILTLLFLFSSLFYFILF